MNKQTKDALERVEKFLGVRNAMGGPIDRTVIHGVQRGDELAELLTADLRQIIDALSERGELLAYSEWLDAQGIIAGDVELTDDSGNATGEIDERSHEELVRAYLEEA